MTANPSLLDSSRTAITSQRISLHYNPQNKTAIWLSLLIKRKQNRLM